ncbi:ABC transporter permease [Limosilactobacillus sp. Sa3CUN2]|uniref:ABC transporter permease n=1 Tax=Limosilactobacillus avistercoris TaxID=2762243 RepID=A0ABR8PC71_9LACO|nr:ABC transporter permease [Limosilactobacillus avistercoris]MBD7894890.1 ABC transporter permease [Limosilactobacillus avistercoris]
MLTQIIHYFQTDSSQYWLYVWQHIYLSLITLSIAMIIALPLGYIGSRIKTVAAFCTAFAQVLRIIPSLALLFLLIPFIGTGMLPALIALVILALPSLLINTILGFNEVSLLYEEVGTALGMDRRQLRRQVEIPLALPYILNGIKLALVEIIASATLATYIGAGGLGTLIFTGLGLYDMTYVVIGGVSVAILSLLSMIGFDFLIRRIQRYDRASYSI